MGGTTPNYGIRFPYQHEVVTPTHFKNMADDIAAGLDNLEVRRAAAMGKPSVKLSGPSTPVAGASNATTTYTWSGSGSSVWWDTHAMWNAGTNDRVTCKAAGLYQITIDCTGANSVSVSLINAFELQIDILGSKPKVFQHKQNTATGTSSPGAWQVFGVWPLQVNDAVRARFWWNGTGTSLSPWLNMTVQCVGLI